MSLSEDDKPLALIRMIERSADTDVLLIFCGRREDVDRLFRRLERLPYSIKALHGGYDQAARFRVMGAFRTGEVKALVATDVASRGLDVVHVTHVVNYAPPRDVTDYTHRIGRTGRAGRKGQAITLVTPLGMRRWNQVLKEASWPIEEVPPPGPSRRSSQRQDQGPRERPERIAPPVPQAPAKPAPDPRFSFPTESAPPPRQDSRSSGRPDSRPPQRPGPRSSPRSGPRRSR
jgi:superfamily II DNA/RNA helicase